MDGLACPRMEAHEASVQIDMCANSPESATPTRELANELAYYENPASQRKVHEAVSLRND